MSKSRETCRNAGGRGGAQGTVSAASQASHISVVVATSCSGASSCSTADRSSEGGAIRQRRVCTSRRYQSSVPITARRFGLAKNARGAATRATASGGIACVARRGGGGDCSRMDGR